MTDERYQKIMADMGMPDSVSLSLALQQVANEVAQEKQAEIEALCKDAAEAATLIESLAREIVYLRHYGNKDCTYMADEAMKRNELEEQTP